MDRMDPDYKMALLLQRQFEQENSKPHATDFRLAQKLQDDFNRELSTGNPTHLIYDHKEKSEDPRSVVDPSWELIDPTPNIHNLFIAFNKRFFWNTLLSVCVAWSKRMTRCAGMCSYQGRGGLCCITLSEPLLKLRPRKDLVETLLHEMIHAYLFLTDNNRDRDGHGPKFHEHMYRINREAATNITVFHTFHEEVRLYQQYWWRCNGPCRNRHPYFGIVRRAINRAPGPSDRWWAEHSHLCGGTFFKVKEPEKNAKSQKGPIRISGSDIRKFLNNSSSTSVQGFAINNICENNKVSHVLVGPGNIHGFINFATPLNGIPNGYSNNKISNLGGETKPKSVNVATRVINQKQSVVHADKSNQIKNDSHVFPGAGKPLISPGKTNSNHDYFAVRKHWINKFNSTSSSNKRNTTEESMLPGNSKKQKTVEQHNLATVNLDDSSSNCVSSSNYVSCPVCHVQINESSLNYHLDMCLQEQNTKRSKKEVCVVCNREIAVSDYRNHADCCFKNMDKMTQCQICYKQFSTTNIEKHQKMCIENMFSGETSNIPESLCGDILAQCPVCDEFVESKRLDNHKKECLLNFNKPLEKQCSQTIDETVACLVCNKKVVKKELNVHLDECMGGVFDTNSDFDEPNRDCEIQKETHNSDNAINVNKYNCPFCMELYSELDMSLHLENCFNNDVKNGDKSIMIDSLSNEDV